MDVRTLRYFVEVVRQQSFTRAAEKMFVTQPTISKMLKNLEDELECTLLIREGRQLHLTDSGQAVYQRGVAILDQFGQLRAELEDISSLKKGRLKLGIPPMVGTQIAGLIGEFRQRYPGIELLISEFGGLTVEQAVLSGELDLALTALSDDDNPDIDSLPLFSHPMCVLVPRTTPWLRRTRLHIRDLAGQNILIYNEDFALYRQLMETFRAQGVTPQIAVRSGQWDFLAAMVQTGVGIAILPEPICQRLDPHALLWIPLEPALMWRLGLIWCHGRYLSHSAQAWIARCRDFWPDGVMHPEHLTQR
ncbi:LysR family transcriptional regulator [Enterobacillus tribolii]|uniref:DNA-binding transcriptional LysR family regulator n=1 Tax=Enterobacillus tribolii TaxID=1487935 RepID=A0A370QGK6_9GAMM|nr:LysR family transcriptional regulator [Enterobacillus tribolii]MBW7981815.1 LysR family transcriptional regulator [Enterobacillus tribolii]RDK87496.1 DNA-binding transcriptional LysR family regulator [Enterobacillus tribolii]